MLLLLLYAVMVSKGQTQYFGQIDTADLKLTTCDFEKDANAMVLFDKTAVNTEYLSTTVTIHRRIKILNDKGLDAANISIEYYGKDNLERISDITAQTINFDNHVIKNIPVNPAQIFKQTVDKYTKKITFSFPAVKAGSVIEYSYVLTMDYEGGFPDWNFQGSLPVRYSEFSAKIIKDFIYAITPRVYTEYVKNTKEPMLDGSNHELGNNYVWAVKNVPAFREEAFSTGFADNVQRVKFVLSLVQHDTHPSYRARITTWGKLAAEILDDVDFGDQLKKNLSDDEKIVESAKLLPAEEDRTRFILGKVRSAMKWDGKNRWFTVDGVKKAWDKKLGNNAEINMILYIFLRQAGIKCSVVLASTREHGKFDVALPDLFYFDKIILGAVNGGKAIMLDATDKFTPFGAMPFDLLNCSALWLDPTSKLYHVDELKDPAPSRQAVFVNAEIKPDGKLEGTTRITRFSYDRAGTLSRFEKLGEVKYKEELANGNNALKILSFSRENVETDTLPLIESAAFRLDISAGDDKYVFINPNMFTNLHTNPFLSETRNSAIDFGSLNAFAIRGVYKYPDGYKIESIPQGISLSMPDNSISFKRIVSEQDRSLLVNYSISFKKTIFPADEYPSIRDFYKKMFEMLNEQIVLKKN